MKRRAAGSRSRGPCFCLLLVACNGGRLDAGWNQPLGEAVRPGGALAPSSPPSAPNQGASRDASAPASAGGATQVDTGVPTSDPPLEDGGPDEPGQTDAAKADAGPVPEPLLPLDPTLPLILSNDGPHDNWQGEYAFLLAQATGPTLAGIVVGVGLTWPNLDENFDGWQDLVTRARESGLAGIPDPVRSDAAPLERPADGNVDSTTPNDSEGARFLVSKSLELARPDRPVVVATGGALTDVADAYLLDPTIAERIVVVASLGSGFSDTEQVARMGVPNGEMDPWAGAIVVQRLRYVQVSAFYENEDVPAERLAELPENPLGDWIRDKQPNIWLNPITSDQVGVLALALPEFTVTTARVSQAGWEGDQPTLAPDAMGRSWLVTESDGAAAVERLWQLLVDPSTYGR